MKYLFTYIYKGATCGQMISGSGSANMTADDAKAVTQELIRDASNWVKLDLEQKGMEDVVVAPMGWLVYAEEDGDGNDNSDQ